MKAYYICILWLFAAFIGQFEFGYGRHAQSRSSSTVIEKAHGNAEHRRRLLRIRKLEQELSKRRRDSWTRDEQEKDETAVIKLKENSTTSPNGYRSENHENSLHHGKHRKKIPCQGHWRENTNCSEGRVHNGYEQKKQTTGGISSRKWKNSYLNQEGRRFPNRKKFKASKTNKMKHNMQSKGNTREHNKTKSDTDNSEDNIRKMKEYLNGVMQKVRPDMNKVGKINQADSTTGTIKDFNSLPELKELWHDIKYLRKYASVLKENAKQTEQTTVEKTKVTDKEDFKSKTTESEEIPTIAVTKSVYHVTAPMSVNVPKTARSHIVPLNKNTSKTLLSDKILWLGVAVGSGFSTTIFILCCCFYKCLLHYRSRVGVPLKDALGLFKSSGEGDRSPMHIKLSHKKGEKGTSQYVVSIMGKNELDLDSGSEEEEEVYNRSAVKSSGNSPMMNKHSLQSTPVKAKKQILQ